MNSERISYLEGSHTDFGIQNKTLRDFIEIIFNENKNSDKVCATLNDSKLRWADLINDASHIAMTLSSFELVAVSMEPSFELLITLCGILLHGIPYVPIEPSLPFERIEYILNDSQTTLLIINSRSTSTQTTKTLTYAELHSTFMIESSYSKKEINNEDTFCLMYTSGSTGQPKGVRLPHRALLNRLHWQWLHFPFDQDEKCCLKTSISFVDSIAEIFAPLICQVPIVIVPKSTLLDMHKLIDVIAYQCISRIVLVPSLLTVLLLYLKNVDQQLHSLRLVVCSGETLSVTLINNFFQLKDRFSPGCRLLNLYGSTEVMADVTYEVFESNDLLFEQFSLDQRTSIGRPIENMRVNIVNVDERNIGELIITGEGVANGYHNVDISNVHLSDKFQKDENGKLRFHTGDLGRIWNNRIFLYGRNDTQIKIAGNRIDLNEVELQLKEHFQCRQPIAVYLDKYGKIVVFLENDENPIKLEHQSLSKYFSSYAIPTKFIKIPKLPLLVSGKINRQELIKMAYENQESDEFGKMRNEKSTVDQEFYSALAEIGISRLNAKQNFLVAGGSSLNALTLIAKLHRIGFEDLNVELLMSLKSLEEILIRRSIMEQTKQRENFFQCDFAYEFVPLERLNKIDAENLLTESFLELSSIDSLIHRNQIHLKSQCKREWFAFLDTIWSYYVASGLSFGILINGEQLVGVSLSKDLTDDPQLATPHMPLLSPLFSMFENGRKQFLETLRSQNLLPKSIMHGFLTAVHPMVQPERRVTIMYLLERQVLQVATMKQFHAVITTNTNSVTQQLADQIFKYDYNQILRVNKYSDANGNFIFSNVDDHHTAIISMKLIK